MGTYFLFGKYTLEGMKGISAERTQEASALVEKFEGEVTAAYALLGEKDLVIIAEFPGIEQAMQGSAALSKLTGIAFSTAPAVAVEDFDKLMAEV
jgi:uncharacterized protein with GYD domain